MRIEIKIALGLFAVCTTFERLLSIPEFISGMLLGLSIFFMMIGLLSENSYKKVKIRQKQKLTSLKRLVGIN